MGWSILAPRQREATELLAGTAMRVCLVGGARSMKTFLIVRAILVRAVKARRSRHLISRFRFNHVKASVMLDTYPTVLRYCFPGLKVETNKSDGVSYLPNESEIWFAGLDEKARVDKILGTEFATLFNNEVSQTPYSSILTLRTRLAQNVRVRGGGQLPLREFNDLNPVGLTHWSNREFGEKRDPLTGRPLPDPQNYARMFLSPKDNPFLPNETLRTLANLGGRWRKRFWDGVYVPEVENALWTLELLARCQCRPVDVPKDMVEVVIAVDPSGTKGKDETKRSSQVGIIAAGRARNGKMYVFADYTCELPPGGKLEPGLPPEQQPGWGAVVVRAFQRWRADRIIGETNYGGAMVGAVIAAVDDNVPFREVTASRGKEVRAEPVSTLYEKDLVLHAGDFPLLEEQLVNFSTAGYQGEGSPDRADALVWAATDLMVDAVSTITLGMPVQVGAGSRIDIGAVSAGGGDDGGYD